MIRIALPVVLALLLLTPASADQNFPRAVTGTTSPGQSSPTAVNAGNSPGWTVYTWNSTLTQPLVGTRAFVYPGGVASFLLLPARYAALLSTESPAFTGDLTGKTVGATLSLANSGTVTYGLEGTPGNTCIAPPTARLWFSTVASTYDPNATPYTNTWWSNPVSVALNVKRNHVTISAPLGTGNWSDSNGQPDTSQPAAFAGAVAGIKQIGLSFGGGCFFDVGIGVSGGSGAVTLNSFSVG